MPNNSGRTATTYKMTKERSELIRDVCRVQQKRHGLKAPLTSIQSVIDAALDAYTPTLEAVLRSDVGQHDAAV